MKYRKLLLPAILFLCLSKSAFSSIIVYEGFDYAGTNITDDTGGGTGLAGNWTVTGGSPDVVAGYSSSSLGTAANPLSTTGGSALTRNSAGLAIRSLTSPISMDSAGVVYFSYVFSAQQSQDTYLNFRGSSVSDLMLVGLKMEGSIPTARSLIGGGTQDLGQTLYTATTYFVVGKITSVASGNDTISASFYTSLPPVSEPGSWDVISSSAVTGSISDIGLNAVSLSDPKAIFDEIRMGTSWDAVAVPEPSTYALMAGVMTLGLVMLRRRRKQA